VHDIDGIAAGAVAVPDTGATWCWGDGFRGQLGDGSLNGLGSTTVKLWLRRSRAV
jgi:hypothetical protein